MEAMRETLCLRYHLRQCRWMIPLVALIAVLCTNAGAQNAQRNYDQKFVPIQPQVLRRELLKADHDSVKLYSLVRQADTQKQIKNAFDTLDQMRHKEPNNATVLAAYCFAFQVADGDYSSLGSKHLSFTPEEHNAYSTLLLKAQSLDPKLWLPYAVEGHNLMLDPEFDKKALGLLQKGVSLAPNISYTHNLLGHAYSVHGTSFMSYEKAAKEFNIARHLQPTIAINAAFLFDIYDIRMPNKEKAADAKQYLLSTVPPDFSFPPAFRERLARY